MWQKHTNLPIEVNPNGCTKNLKTMNETFEKYESNKIGNDYDKKFKMMQTQFFDKHETKDAVNTIGLLELLDEITLNNESSFNNFILYLLILFRGGGGKKRDIDR